MYVFSSRFSPLQSTDDLSRVTGAEELENPVLKNCGNGVQTALTLRTGLSSESLSLLETISSVESSIRFFSIACLKSYSVFNFSGHFILDLRSPCLNSREKLLNLLKFSRVLLFFCLLLQFFFIFAVTTKTVK